MPSRERSERREQKRAVEAKLGDGEMEGEEEGTGRFWMAVKVYRAVGAEEGSIMLIGWQVKGKLQTVGHKRKKGSR